MLQRSGSILLYLAAAGLPAIANFLLTPVLLQALGDSGFASWALLEPILLLGAALCTAGSQYGALHAVSTGAATPRSALSSSLATVAIAGPLAVVSTLAVLNVTSSPLAPSVVFWLAVAQIVDAASAVTAAILRSMRRPALMVVHDGIRSMAILGAVAAVSATAATIGFTITTVLMLRSVLTAMMCIGVVLLFIGRSAPTIESSLSYVRYGIPILIGQVLMLGFTSIDRYFAAPAGLMTSELSSYVVHLRVAGLLNLAILAPISLWFPIEAMRRKAECSGDFYRGVTVALILAFIAVGLALHLLSPMLWNFVFPSVDLDRGLLLCCAAFVGLQGLAVVWNVGGLRRGMTMWNIVPAAAACAVLLVVALPLAKLWGALGLAAARAIAGVTCALTVYVISNRIVRVPMRHLQLLPLYIAVAGIGALPVVEGSLSYTGVLVAAIVSTAAFGMMVNRAALAALVQSSGPGAELPTSE